MHEKPTPTTTASQLHLIQEGATEFLVPPSLSSGKARGPGRARAGVFFNPASAFARDLSVLYLAAVVQPGMRVLDGLTGVGARASRWRREAPGDYQLTANDESPQAIAIARLNLCTGAQRGKPAGRGGCAETPRVLQRPLGALLAEEPFDLIELDAAGTPMPFLDAACQSVLAALTGSHPGHLLVTATDSLVLAGVQPDVCRRRYGARPLRGELAQEIAVRILAGAIVRTAARYGLAAVPALSYWHAHVYGAFVRLVKNYRAADAALDTLGYVVSCPWCWDRRAVPGEFPSLFCAVCGRSAQLAGPLWTGRLWDTVLLHQLLADNRCLATGEKVRAALTGWLAESAAPPLFYDLHAAAAHCGAVAMPRLEVVKQRLTSSGYLAVRTHFSRAGIKTDAGPDHLLRVIGAPKHYAGRTALGTRLRNVGDQERDGDPKG